ncbi:MAG: hemolytic protein HlpA [Hymenobacter sp.]
MSPLTTPVLLIVFNRAAPAKRVLAAIRHARPGRLYVAADGPRPGHPTDAVRCAETRALVASEVDWPCQVRTLFGTANLGCGRGPVAAINWFFEHEPEGIVLEDDCLPSLPFFRFCEELLTRYRHDTRVMHIGGNNFSPAAAEPATAGAESYYFSGQVHSWGWASWRRAWQHYDFTYALLPELMRRGALHGSYPSALARQYWLRRFEAGRTGPQPPQVWDYQWHFTVAAHSGLSIVPAVNLVTNIGFGDDATHTFDRYDRWSQLRTVELEFPLRHPPTVLRDWQRDRRRFHAFLAERTIGRVWRLLGRLLPLAPPEGAAEPLPESVSPFPSTSAAL